MQRSDKDVTHLLSKARTLASLGYFEEAHSSLISYTDNASIEEELGHLEGKITDEPYKTSLQLLKTNHTTEAKDLALSTLKNYPRANALWQVVGVSAMTLADHSLAVKAFSKAYRLNPKDAGNLCNLGAAYRGIGDVTNALKTYQAALNLKPNLLDAHFNLGVLYKSCARLHQAIECFNNALLIDGKHYNSLLNLGNAYRAVGNFSEALNAYDRCSKINPSSAILWNNLGLLYSNHGMAKAAEAHFHKALQLNPSLVSALQNLCMISPPERGSDPYIAFKKLLSQESQLSLLDRAQLQYSAFRIADRNTKYQQAFDHLTLANKLNKERINYSRDLDSKRFHYLKNHAKYLKTWDRNPQHISCRPIFIVGMPRSGTTLLEQILSSHSEIFGLGELPHAETYFLPLVDAGKLNRQTVRNFREHYLDLISRQPITTKYFTDKMPLNFRFIPFISEAIPEAKFLHIRRSAHATCWSNFSLFFPARDLGFTNDLSDLTNYNKKYVDLMDIYNQKMSDRIFNINYDDLTENPQHNITRILDYLGLDIESNTFSPEKNIRGVSTASSQQVRSGIYKGSSTNWKRYNDFLIGTFEALNKI